MAGLALLAGLGAGNAAVVRLQRSAGDAAGEVMSRPPDTFVDSVRASGSGTALPHGVREDAESSFGTDLSGVRVHRDVDADTAAREVSAKAFTVGPDIYFAAGHYDPDTAGGRQLLGHELTHVTQQTNGAAGGSSWLSQPGDPAELAAEASGRRFARGESAVPAAGGPAHVARAPDGPLAADPGLAGRAGAGPVAAAGPADPGPIGFIPLDGWQISSDPQTAKRQLLEIALKEGVQAARQVELGLRLRRAALGLDRPPVAPETASGMMREAAVYEAVAAALRDELQRWSAFEQTFEKRAREQATDMLDLSGKRVAAERDHYGLTKTQDYLPTELGPVPVDAYGMAAGPATAALADAARQLLDALTPLQEATKKLEAIQVDESPGTWEFDIGQRPTAPDPAALAAAQQEVRSTQRRYLLLRNEKETGFPVLASFAAYKFLHTYDLKGVRENLETVARGAAGGDQSAALVAGDVFQKLENITTVRAALAGGSLNVWSADNLIAMTKDGLGVTPGSLEDRIVDQKVADDQSDRMLRDLFIGVFALALGLIAAPLTGGGSMAVAAGAVATAGSVGLSASLAIQHAQQYQLDNAANATDFDKARVISSADPSLFWLALDVVLVGLDIAAAAKVFAKLAPLARQAVRASGKEAKAALDVLEKTAEAEAPALGAPVRKSAEDVMKPIGGFAQNPRLKWQPNPDGVIRTRDEAVALARRHGVEIPEDILFGLVQQEDLPANAFAAYAQLGDTSATKRIYWDEFYNRYEMIPVRLSRGILNSDEAIVAVIGHEMHELNALRKLFDENGGHMLALDLHRAIVPGRRGNLHDQAWDVADKLVTGMRSGGSKPP